LARVQASIDWAALGVILLAVALIVPLITK
jgi:hypothetical protein